MNTYHHMTPIERFAAYIVNKPLYDYQAQVANAIIHSIEHNEGAIISVMMSRQSGKNQLSAIIEAFLLFTDAKAPSSKRHPRFLRRF